MGLSTCVGCGECVQACPTGALLPATRLALPRQAQESRVDSLCPYCGVGCQVTYHVRDGRIVEVEGRDGPANHGRLCVKGRFGFDYPRHPQRLMRPLIRKPGVPKTMDLDPANPAAAFREASWDEALDFAAAGLKRIKETHGSSGSGRLRLGQGQQRGSLSVPEAGAHRLRQQQRRSLHPPVPRLERGGAAGGHRLGCGVESGVATWSTPTSSSSSAPIRR